MFSWSSSFLQNNKYVRQGKLAMKNDRISKKCDWMVETHKNITIAIFTRGTEVHNHKLVLLVSEQYQNWWSLSVKEEKD